MVPASPREALSPERVSLCAQEGVGGLWLWGLPCPLTWGYSSVRHGWGGAGEGIRRERKEKERKSKGPYL